MAGEVQRTRLGGLTHHGGAAWKLFAKQRSLIADLCQSAPGRENRLAYHTAAQRAHNRKFMEHVQKFTTEKQATPTKTGRGRNSAEASSEKMARKSRNKGSLCWCSSGDADQQGSEIPQSTRGTGLLKESVGTASAGRDWGKRASAGVEGKVFIIAQQTSSHMTQNSSWHPLQESQTFVQKIL